MASREQNERKYKHWEELPNGGRRYIRQFIPARVDAHATSKKWTKPTIRFDLHRKSTMPAVVSLQPHEKFPVDLGHKQL
jgi:hypothetical protein